MKEYGGYIEYEYNHGKEYHENAIALNSGRHCIEYLVRVKHIKKIYLPYFICSSVIEICKKMNVEIEYYHINKDFMPAFNKICKPNEWLYIVNFYGQISNEKIKYLKEAHHNIIVDNAQAFFQHPLSNIDTVYTCRKFFGVSDGGYLYTDTFIQNELVQDYSYERMKFLLGRFEKSANEFYCQYVENNELFAKENMKQMSKLTKNILRGIDYDRIINVRTENYLYLHNQLKEINNLNLVVSKGGFMYPLHVSNGIKIREQLKRRKIYIPVLWPEVLKLCTEADIEYDWAKNILPLPIDQRYSVNDMDYIVKEIRRCIN